MIRFCLTNPQILYLLLWLSVWSFNFQSFCFILTVWYICIRVWSYSFTFYLEFSLLGIVIWKLSGRMVVQFLHLLSSFIFLNVQIVRILILNVTSNYRIVWFFLQFVWIILLLNSWCFVGKRDLYFVLYLRFVYVMILILRVRELLWFLKLFYI